MFNKTADGIIGKFTKAVAELEAHAQAKANEAADLKVRLTAANEECGKAANYAEKLKKIFQ